MPKHIKTNDILNKTFGRLTVIEDLGTIDHIRYLIVKCNCGIIKRCRLSGLRNKKNPVLSCGCLGVENHFKKLFKHGLLKERLYYIWSNIRQRCNNQDRHDYHNYGGRGISVCKEWDDFLSFYKWAKENGYRKTKNRNCLIDRIDNDGNYEPDNCRWVNSKISSNNRRVTLFVDYNGEKICFSDWCGKYGLKRKITHQRIFRDKMTFDEVVKNFGELK